MIRPIGACCFKEGIRMGTEVFHNLGESCSMTVASLPQ